MAVKISAVQARKAGAEQLVARFPKTSMMALLGALVLVLSLVAPTPAQATDMGSIKGNLTCTAFPQIWIASTATAKGTVDFQMNKPNNTGQIGYVSLGYSAAYASWGWTWWNTSVGNFYVYAFGAIGDVTTLNRWCRASY